MPHIKARMSHRTPGCRRTGECPKRGDWRGNRIREIRKLRGDFSSTVLLRSCPNKDSVALVIRLNSTSLSPNSFLLSLTSTTISDHTCPFVALLDSGSSHCFIDKVFAKKNKLALSKLPSIIPLRLFDGSARNSVSHKTNIPLTFSTGETHQTELYVTKLDKGYSVILGYNWLVCHNPSINWAETKVVFLGAMKAPERPSASIKLKFNIQLVSAKNTSCLCHEPGNSIYCLEHHSITGDENTSQQLSNPHTEPPSDPYSIRTSSLAPESMSKIPVDYHEFQDILSDAKANTLPPH